jgi:hypothetical protein
MSDERVREMTMKVMSEEHKLIMKEVNTLAASILEYLKNIRESLKYCTTAFGMELPPIEGQDDGDRPVSTYEKEQFKKGLDGEKLMAKSLGVSSVNPPTTTESSENSKPSETEKKKYAFYDCLVLSHSKKAVQVLMNNTQQWFPNKSIYNLDEINLIETKQFQTFKFGWWIIELKGLEALFNE